MRRVIQISSHHEPANEALGQYATERVIALCDDGTIWVLTDWRSGWEEVQPPPGCSPDP